MKTIGLIGGISWVSTLEYYRLINEMVNKKLGGGEYARLVMHSMNFGDIQRYQSTGNLNGIFDMVSDACANMKLGGAKALLLCANTMHMFADQLEAKHQLPVIHVAKATADEIVRSGMKKVGLLGTKFTMERDFFKDHLTAKGIACEIPEEADRIFIHESIGSELGRGIFTEAMKKEYQRIIDTLIARGCKGIVLGCTEIPLLIKPQDCPVRTFDTTYIHSQAAADFICG